MKRQKMLLVFNPKAGHGDFPINLFEVVDKFTRHGYEVTVVPTQGPRDAYERILERAKGVDCLVCSGGDGTLNEAVDALMMLEKKPVFGYIPSGTTNDFATSLDLPKDILQAAGVITDGVPVAIDIGQFADEYFSYVAAFGLFTDVPYDTPQGLKNVLGHMAYLLEGAKRLASIQSHRCVVDIDGERVKGDFLVGLVTNSQSVAGFKLPAEFDTKMNDGLFEVTLIRRPRSFVDLQGIIASLINGEIYTKSITVRKASEITFRAEEPLKWTLDGEFGGELDRVSVRNRCQAIEIMMPRGPVDVIEE